MPVKVFRINRKEIIDKLRLWAKNLSRDKNVLAVVLFGSFATEEETPASDADVLILLKESKERFDNRILKFIPSKIGVGVDVFPYTIEEFHSSIDGKWGIAGEVIKNGILLYGVDNAKKLMPFHNWFCALNEYLGRIRNKLGSVSEE
ncbi:MAG: nucleotidyltransferase family protein [Bacteroidales bacterium]